MKNYMATFDYCRELLWDLEIPFGEVVAVEVNPRLRRAVGRCCIVKTYFYGEPDFKIELNPAVVEDSTPDSELETTILHELLHTCPGCWNHGATWSRYAAKVNRAYGYNVSRLIDCNSAEQRRNQVEPYKYICACEKCGVEWKYKRLCGCVKNPKRYIHTGCGGHLYLKWHDPKIQILGLNPTF